MGYGDYLKFLYQYQLWLWLGFINVISIEMWFYIFSHRPMLITYDLACVLMMFVIYMCLIVFLIMWMIIMMNDMTIMESKYCLIIIWIWLPTEYLFELGITT